MKKFEKMSTAKLNNLLNDENTSAEDREAIMDILAIRGAALPAVPSEDQPAGESADEPAMETTEEAAKRKTKEKLTYEEVKAFAKTLEVNVGHRCQVVPFNSIDWMEGTIKAVLPDKRSLKVLYAIVLDDGKKIVKAHDAKHLKISEETKELPKRGRTSSNEPKLSDTELMQLAEELYNKVGNHVEYTPTKEIYILTDGKPVIVEKLVGTIMAIVPEKRARRILLRIENELKVYDHLTETEKTIVLTTHKTSVAPDVKILDTFDEEVKTAFEKRRATRQSLANMTPADQLEMAKKAVAKAEANLTTALSALEVRKAELEAAEQKMAEWLEAGNMVPEATETEATAENVAD